MSVFPIKIDAALHIELIRALSENLKTYYVFPEVADTICACLQEYLETGEYAELRTGEDMASVLTAHLQEASQDKHLRVRWQAQPLPDKKITLHENQEWLEERKQQAVFDNYGLHKAERLPGNVSCLDYQSHQWNQLGRKGGQTRYPHPAGKSLYPRLPPGAGRGPAGFTGSGIQAGHYAEARSKKTLKKIDDI